MGYGWSDPAAIPPPGLFNMSRAGVVVTQHTLLQVDVVFTALRIISTAILKMGDPRAYTLALSSPDNIPYRQYLAKQPGVLTDTWGGQLMQYDGRRRTIMSMALFGEAFWYVLDRDPKPSNYGRPSALEVLHPAFMEVKADDQGGPVYVYGSGQNKRVLPNENVVHIPFMAMPAAKRALSTVEYLGVSGALAMAAYEFGSTWFAQGPSPSFILSTDQKLGQAEVERIAQKFTIEHSGLQSSHLPLVLDSGLKADKVMASPDEAQYLETLEYARNVIASWFGIPETLLPNALQRQPAPAPHTAEEEVRRFVLYTLSGYTTPLEEAYAMLLPPDQFVSFPEDSLSRPDSQFLAQEIMALRQTQVATPNDLRVRKLNWPPLDDPAADQALNPLASNTAPEQTRPPAAPTVP
jgi:HK97 family phage portal protein